MANTKKPNPDKRLQRCVTLSDNEVKLIKKKSGKKNLSPAIRELVRPRYDQEQFLKEFERLLKKAVNNE